MYSYFVSSTDPPRVFTAAAYRRHPAHKEDHLAARFVCRADASSWTDTECEFIAAFSKDFKPVWELPQGQFSDWHYMVLNYRTSPNVYHYQKPVLVLMNAKCFSATDIFLAGLKCLKQVTLMGTASGGGSACSQTISLANTLLELRIGSMASFQADGTLFDGRGVQPDIVVWPEPKYHIGGVDNVLADAVKRIMSEIR